MEPKIAIQGIEHSFHHLATTQLFGRNQFQLVKCNSFDKVVKSVIAKDSDYGIIALENTIAGSILPNYHLIDTHNIQILDETFLNIQMQFMALHGQQIHEIQEVRSHPVALLQCKQYLKQYPHIKLTESRDTSSAAKHIKEQQLRGIAAIAGMQVAEAFDLEVLGRDIQSMKNNQTRFVLLGRTEDTVIQEKIANKASLKFELHHDVGSLANILQMLGMYKINLTKIQSIPIVGKPWQYAFFIDVLFDDYKLFIKVLDMLRAAVLQLKILGVYRHNKSNQISLLAKK